MIVLGVLAVVVAVGSAAAGSWWTTVGMVLVVAGLLVGERERHRRASE